MLPSDAGGSWYEYEFPANTLSRIRESHYLKYVSNAKDERTLAVPSLIHGSPLLQLPVDITTLRSALGLLCETNPSPMTPYSFLVQVGPRFSVYQHIPAGAVVHRRTPFNAAPPRSRRF